MWKYVRTLKNYFTEHLGIEFRTNFILVVLIYVF